MIPKTGSGPIRILLVICRPSGGRNVPFGSISMHILKRLDKGARQC